MSILECYNTKIIPMRNGRGIAGAHIKYKRGDDGSDRVLCVTPVVSYNNRAVDFTLI